MSMVIPMKEHFVSYTTIVFFAEPFYKDNSFTIHERNIQHLGIEFYKVTNGLSPVMSQVFPQKDIIRYPSENVPSKLQM